MPSLEQLEAEPWWDREIVTPEMDWLGDELSRRTGRPRDAFGTKGNTVHTSGGHRSQEWIKNSAYCDNHSYTVQSGLSAEQARHIAAGDWTPGQWGTVANRALVAVQTRALRDAALRGDLAGLTQIMGTLDGRTPWGINLPAGTTFRPDSSHLDHWHVTGDRKRMRDKALMQKILEVVIGVVMDELGWLVLIYRMEALVGMLETVRDGPHKGQPMPFVTALKEMLAILRELKARPAVQPAPVDIDALAAKLAPMVELAAERAVRKVLGAVDGATPGS